MYTCGMFSFLEGVPMEEGDGTVSVNVGGVGYRVFVPERIYKEICGKKRILLRTHTVVTDRAFSIFGFTTNIDRGVFLSLLKVPGIGPKKAMSVLGKADGIFISKAIAEKKTESLAACGISTQQAEKIILELTKSIQGSQREGLEHLIELLISLGYSKKEAVASVSGIDAEKNTPLSAQLRHALQHIHTTHP